jgi:hypothetical protein
MNVMLKPLISRNWLPPALGRQHPLTRYYLRKPPSTHVKQVIFGSSLGLFLLFGGLSLPMLYFLFSLVVLLQLGTGTAHKIQQARADGVADLVNLSLLSHREILLSTWASGIWQLRQSRLMLLYRLSHGLLLIGVLVFSITFGDIPADKGLLVVLGVTTLIALQPYVEMYFSGMIGLLCGAYIHDRFSALAATVVIMLLYWMLWVGAGLLVAVLGLKNLQNAQIALIFALPLLLPAAVGCAAQYLSERALP